MGKMAKVRSQKDRGVKRAAKAQERAKAKKAAAAKKAPAKKSAAAPPAEAKKPRKRHFAAPELPDVSAKVVDPVLPPGATERERDLRRLMSLDETGLKVAEETQAISAEDRAVLEARAYCQALLRRNDDALSVLGSIIAVRRTYQVLYHELQELLEKEAAADRPPPQMAEDYLVHSAMHHAAQPFSEHDLMRGYVETVLPHIADIVDRHAKADEAAAREAERKEIEERPKRPVPLGFLLDLESADDGLPRDRSLVLLGWENAVLFVLDRITDHVLAAGKAKDPVQVVRFRDSAPKTHDPDALLIDLAPKQWHGCCNSEKALAVCMGVHVADRQVRLVDLLVFDDLAKAYTKGFVGRPKGADAGDAHKTARRWATKGGAGLIAAVPLPERGDPDWRAPELEQLRTFATLRIVRVVEEAANLAPDKLRVVVGSSLHHWDVDRAVLEGYGRATIITPGD